MNQDIVKVKGVLLLVLVLGIPNRKGASNDYKKGPGSVSGPSRKLFFKINLINSINLIN